MQAMQDSARFGYRRIATQLNKRASGNKLG